MLSRRILLGLGLGLLAGLTGVLISITPLGLALEENLGLDGLFELRGARPAPSEVVVVSIDKTSAQRFGLANEPRKWPRDLHARLLENITRAGAGVVGFDLHFEEPRDPVHDQHFARAIRQAGNVVLFSRLDKETRTLADAADRAGTEAITERLSPPLPLLAQAAVANAPFPLPKVPVKVSQFWLFKDGAGEAATLPVVMFQLYARAAYQPLRRFLQDYSPDAAMLPVDLITQGHDLGLVIAQLRSILQQPGIAESLLKRVAVDPTLNNELRRSLTALINIYRDGSSRYLNYYGPPHSLTTLNYYDVWQAQAGRGAPFDLRNKIVLVGFSEHRQSEQKDGFYTVYSQQSSGLDISGVEIAATALANMIENNPIRGLSISTQLSLIFGWGLLLGLVVAWRRVAAAIGMLVLLSASYFVLAQTLFSGQSLWLPWVVPLLIQAPAVLFVAMWWHYREAARERDRIRLAFRNYLPERAVAALARDINATPGRELLHGVCLATDASRYTALAERTAPEELATFMNRYYETLFQPVHAHGGFVSDVLGDAMLAVWAQVKPDAAQRAHACNAALEVAETARRFSDSLDSRGMATRIGLHAGPILLGPIGATEHFEYRAVGDIVNTASRLQALNKILGTQLLASRETIAGLAEFTVRDLGLFRLPGKDQATAVVELRGLAADLKEAEQALLQGFADALSKFNAQRFHAAQTGFARVLEQFPADGPSQYYRLLSERYLAEPPAANWDGVVRVAERASVRNASS